LPLTSVNGHRESRKVRALAQTIVAKATNNFAILSVS